MFDFSKDVVERSFQKPILVDFWAPWCGPCRILGPVLEDLAEENADRFDLVKVNTEDYQEIAMTYRIMSIPNVKLFFRGEAIAEFVGALPKTSIERWLDQYLPGSPVLVLSDILDKEEDWPDDNVKEKLEQFVDKNPEMKAARVALAKHLVLEDPAQALGLVADTSLGDESYETAEDVRNLADFLSLALENGSQASKLLLSARDAFNLGERENAIKLIIDATIADKSYHDGLPRRVAIAIFRIFGNNHPLTRQYRKIFDMALY